MVYHDYGEVPQVWHTRLVLGHVQGLEFLIQTPDGDIYPEILDVSNPDLVNFVPGDDGAAGLGGSQHLRFSSHDSS